MPTAERGPAVGPSHSAATRRPAVVVCGETLIDLVPAADGLWRALPGGGPANTAVALARLQTPTAMLARISGDAFGARLRARLVDNGVDLRFVAAATEPSTLAVVALDEDGGARYSFYLDGTADWQWQQPELPVAFDDAVVAVHAGSMGLFRQPGGSVLEGLLARERDRRVISIDPNVRAVLCPDPARYREVVERWLTLAHLVKASTDDVERLYPGRLPVDVLHEWASRGPHVVVLTRGADGAIARTRTGSSVTVPGVPVGVVDTIGAGDTYSAALLHSLATADLLHIETLAELTVDQLASAMRFAARAAAITCTRAGADPPYAKEL